MSQNILKRSIERMQSTVTDGEKQKELDTFQEVLSDAMRKKSIKTAREFERYLFKAGIDYIKFRRIAEYKQGVVVPPFEKAKVMLDSLEYDITEDKLIRILSNSKKSLSSTKEEMAGGQSFRKTKSVTLNYKIIDKTKDADAVNTIIEERIEELFGNKSSFSAYINLLIKKDYNEYILNREKVEEELKYDD